MNISNFIKYLAIFTVTVSIFFLVEKLVFNTAQYNDSSSVNYNSTFNKPLLKLKSDLTNAFPQMDLNNKLKLLAVGLHDNRALLWSLDQPAEPRVFSTPVLNEQNKRSHPVAIDPKGRWLAYGVPASAGNNNDSAKIFLFDLKTGKVIYLIDHLESRAQAVQFSPDGRYLAASLSEGFGLRIWDAEKWDLIRRHDPVTEIPVEEQKKFKLFEANHPGLAFNPTQSGRVGLVMVGDTGVWCFGNEPDFKPVSCLEQDNLSWIEADEAYNSVAFSPDGNRIAIGSMRSTNVLILSLMGSEKTIVLVPPDNGKRYKGEQFLSEVAWSSNSRYLYAGGVFWLGNPETETPENSLVRWDLQSNNRVQIFPAGSNTVMGLSPLGIESVVYVSQDPVIDVVKAKSDQDIATRLFPIQSGNLDFRYWKEKNFLASEDGLSIAIKPHGEEQFVQFDLLNKSVAYVERPGFVPAPVYQIADMVSLENVRNIPVREGDSRRPSLNGNPLVLDGHEISRDYAFLPSGKEFIWLTSGEISFIQSDGKKKWSHKIQHEGFRAILAGKGRLTIVAYSDGTISWYVTETGKLLLTLFIARPKTNELKNRSIDWKWVAWTPEGFYSSSVAGEELVGWLVNDPADPNNPIYYDFGTFREKFYRPDIIKEILKIRDIQQTYKIVNEKVGLPADEKIEDMLTSVVNKAPPSIDILSPKSSDVIKPGKIDFCFKLRRPTSSRNMPKDVNISLFGGAVKLLASNLEYNKRICQPIDIPESLPQGGGAISLNAAVASNDESIRGVQQDTVTVIYEGEQEMTKPRLFGLFVGISEYDQKGLKLNFAEKDAMDMEKFWKKQQGNPYREVIIRRIQGSEATRGQILEELQQLKNRLEPEDFVILYFAGHGATLTGSSRYLFFSRNADTSNINNLINNSLTDKDLKDALKEMKARFKVVIMDTCRNLLSSNTRLERVDFAALSKEVKDYWNAHAFFSTGENEYSKETNGNGVYTKFLLSGLAGKADKSDPKDKAISINELDLYTDESVVRETNEQQHPMIITPENLANTRNRPPILTLK